MNKRRTIAVSLKLLISVALIWFVLDAVGVEDSFARILSADASWLALALAIGMVQVLICTLRWLAVLKGIDADLGFVQARCRRSHRIGRSSQALRGRFGPMPVRRWSVRKPR